MKNNYSKVKFYTIVFLIFVSALANAQLTIIIDQLPDDTPSKSRIFFAGNINDWTPNDPLFSFSLNSDGKYFIFLDSLELEDNLQYKLTRGSWDLVEVNSEGKDLKDRSYTYLGPDTIVLNVAKWKNPIVSNKVTSSLSYNVEIITDSFYMPQLNRYRRIWVYLPPDYEIEEDILYPVLYMQDGQNLFDNSTSSYGEWHVDEHLNALFDQGYIVPIVIGIDHGETARLNEYSIEKSEDYNINPKGDLYLEFVVKTLKPYIDSHYRTLSGKENTGIMGSSLGAVISAYAILKESDVFNLAGIFSPSYKMAGSLYSYPLVKSESIRIYELCGSNESKDMVSNMMKMDSLFMSYNDSREQIQYKVVEGAKHNETLWSNGFKEAIIFLFNP
jgi:predicted alpha/beta superfamily hydrolase